MPRLTLLLGGGGVGKTTLAAALALAEARAGRRVGLLGVDPARRLRSALHLDALPDEGVTVEGTLRAALLEPEVCLRRWAVEACPDALQDPFFVGLADRLASATDAIAAARAAEWAEDDPLLEDLIVDTAPGVAGIELVARPEKLMALFEGRLIRWLREAGHGGRLIAGLSRLGGAETLARLGDFFTLVDAGLERLSERLQRAIGWLQEARLIVVARPNDAAARAAIEIADALRALGLQPESAVLNRALPVELPPPPALPEARPFFAYVDNYRSLQMRVRGELARHFARVVPIGESASLDLDGLAALGRDLT